MAACPGNSPPELGLAQFAAFMGTCSGGGAPTVLSIKFLRRADDKEYEIVRSVGPASSYSKIRFHPTRRPAQMFKGDIAKFCPADLLMFLTHLKKEGLLTVTKRNEGLSICFNNGYLVDAQSERADGKILRALYVRKLIDQDQFNYISRAKKETGLPLRQILENIESFSVSSIREILEDGIKEVLFQLFLWETGEFQFAEITVDPQDSQSSYDCQSLILEITHHVDEYREIVRSITSADRIPTKTASGAGATGTSFLERFVMGYADGKRSVRWIAAAAPFPTYEVMRALQRCLAEGWIEFLQTGREAASTGRVSGQDRMFFSYKRSLKKILLAKETQPKISEIINFCKDHFDYTLVFVLKSDGLVRYVRLCRNPQGQLQRTELQDIRIRINEDPIFDWVHESKLPFFGRVFSSRLLDALKETPPDGECAIIPLGKIDHHGFLIYVASAGAADEPGPFHYLELMSWHVNPPIKDVPRTVQSAAARNGQRPREPAPHPTTPPRSEDKMHLMVETIRELPAMPNVVARILQLLSDPDSRMSEITETLSRDQALVARLIKVSNSALYARGQKITTLSQAITRLGARIIRSLILAAYTRSLFPTDQTNVGIWGQSLWQHSIECGIASRRVAELVRYGDPEEAFVGGVLHDIGKVVILLNLPEEYRLIRKKRTSAIMSSIDAEEEVLGFDHTRVGELLLEKWNMPGSLKTSVRYHHQPQDSREFEKLAYIIACGDYLSHIHGAQPDKTQAEEFIDIEAIMENLNLSEDQMQVLQGTVIEDFEHSAVLV